MAARAQRPKLLVIVGPTASGKSELAFQIAKKYKAEIICADSRTVYKGMDIGTAKPSKLESRQVPHYGLDLVEPGQRFTVAKFRSYADKKIKDINARGKLAILVGGTGLYIDAVLFGYSFRADADPRLRLRLEKLPIEELQAIIKAKDYSMPLNSQNRRHLIRTIETKGKVVVSDKKVPGGTVIIGLMPEDAVLKERIAMRAKRMFTEGVIEETAALISKYGEQAIAGSGGIIYQISQRIIKGEIPKKEALELVKIADWQYARRQRTWFKKNEQIKWFKDADKAQKYIEKLLFGTTSY